MLEHFFGQESFMDPTMDPKMDPARLISEDPCLKKALQGPFMAQIDHFFLHRSLDNGQT